MNDDAHETFILTNKMYGNDNFIFVRLIESHMIYL